MPIKTRGISMFNSTISNCTSADEAIGSLDYVIVVLLLLVILISISGNISILLVVHRNGSMQTFANILICNCSVADLLTTMIPSVWEVADILEYRGRWPLGSFMCIFSTMSVYLSVAASTNTLTVITVDRFFAVMYPYEKYFKVKHLLFIIPLIWLIAFLFASPTIFVQKVIFVEDNKPICIEKWPSLLYPKESPKHYTLILFVFLYLIPLVVMTILYMIIIKKLSDLMLRKESRKLQEKEEMKTFSNSLTPVIPQETSQLTSSSKKFGVTTHLRKSVGFPKNRVIKMLILIVIAFAVCWFPVYLLQFLMFFHPKFIECPLALPAWASSIAFFMQYANSAIRPLIYFGFSDTYMKALRKTFRPFARRRKDSTLIINGQSSVKHNDKAL